MGNGASQAQHQARMEELRRGGRVIGPPMSPTPPPYPGEVRDDRPPKLPLGLGADDDNARSISASASPKSIKKKKKKKKKDKKKRKNKERRESLDNGAVSDHPAPDAPSDPAAMAAADDDAVQLKIEPGIDANDIPDHELAIRIAGDSIVDGEPSQQKSPFMHKREMSIVDGRSDLASDDEAPIPELQPSQIKPEPPSESESDLGSPSVARLDRLERSRSRSISRPPLVRPANQSFHAGERAASTAPSRSSTGSNESIPAQPQDTRPTSRGSAHSSGRHAAQQNGDAMDLDVEDQVLGNGHVSPREKQAKRPKSARKPASHQRVNGITTEASDAAEHPDASASPRKRTAQKGRKRQGDNPMSNTDVDKVANWLSQPARRRTHSDVVEESDHEAAGQSAEAVVYNTPQDEMDTEQEIQQQLSQQVQIRDTEAPADHEPEVSATQPKKTKKKRQLHSKESLSLSQLEDDFGEGDSQPRVSLSQRSKLKDVMRGDHNTPEDETGTNFEPSQDPTVPKQTKPKRKRRSNDDASEDELENLLAGPSRRKKSKKSSKGLGPNDHEKTAAKPKKKRLSESGVATGAWNTEELEALGQVVEQFRQGYDMSQFEVNSLIHQRPDTDNPMHKDFWDSAVAAIHKRNKKQIVERTRRLYNNFVGRGRWTDEQKKELHELFDTHGTKFAEIASLVNRDQKDVRDYWRNQYVVHEHQRKWYWKPDETEKLKQAVEEGLNKIRIDRENNDQFRPRPRAKGFDDESLLDWQQISSAIGLTRNRQQCKWKWQELKDKGDVGNENDHLPEAPRQSRTINGLSEVLANAREDYRVMSTDDKLQLIEAIHDSGFAKDSKIKWRLLVDEHFRAKWRRATLKLVWFRLRKTVPDHEDQDVQSNARYLINYYMTHQSLPRIEDHQADDQVEEKLVNTVPGSKVWRTPSQEPRAVRERQRRSSSASSRASSRASEKVSSQFLRIPDDRDDQDDMPEQRGRDRTPKSGSADLGEGAVEAAEEEQQQQRKRSKKKGKSTREKKREEAVPIRIPQHLNGEVAE